MLLKGLLLVLGILSLVFNSIRLYPFRQELRRRTSASMKAAEHVAAITTRRRETEPQNTVSYSNETALEHHQSPSRITIETESAVHDSAASGAVAAAAGTTPLLEQSRASNTEREWSHYGVHPPTKDRRDHDKETI